jgi:hypothetical protein
MPEDMTNVANSDRTTKLSETTREPFFAPE